jgi:predicted AlkP superfamily pyrophosphatase or phosphodiesterase
VLVASAVQAGEPQVLVLSWDGVQPGYIDRADTPGLDRVRREGTEAEYLVPVFPSSTFPAHVSLATGTYVDRHGIVGNVFRDRDRGLFRYSDDASWMEAEPIWVAAERQGVRAAVFFWVGSQTDWRGIGATYRRTPFDEAIPESEKVDQILAWLDLPEDRRPRLILSWWHGCDEVGHRWGPESRRIAGQLASQDRELVRLLDELDAREAWDDTTLVLVSDHGMVLVNKPIDLGAVLRKGGVRAEVINGGGMARVYLWEARDRPKALELLSAVPGVKAYPAESLPPRLRAYHPRRTGDIVALAEPPRVFGQPSRTERLLGPVARLFGLGRGAHGFDPELPGMSAILLAMGRGVPVGEQIGPQRAVDVAPTIARLLGIAPPRQAEGRAIPGFGRGAEVEPIR